VIQDDKFCLVFGFAERDGGVVVTFESASFGGLIL